MHLTDCECTEPGWCERHECNKSWRLHQMCRRSRSYFQAWEEGRGPGMVTRAVNFVSAVVTHAATGAQLVDDSVVAERLAACQSCESCDKDRMVCRQLGCGCYVKLKATWKSQDCPAGKWAPVKELAEETEGSTDRDVAPNGTA